MLYSLLCTPEIFTIHYGEIKTVVNDKLDLKLYEFTIHYGEIKTTDSSEKTMSERLIYNPLW